MRGWRAGSSGAGTGYRRGRRTGRDRRDRRSGIRPPALAPARQVLARPPRPSRFGARAEAPDQPGARGASGPGYWPPPEAVLRLTNGTIRHRRRRPAQGQATPRRRPAYAARARATGKISSGLAFTCAASALKRRTDLVGVQAKHGRVATQERKHIGVARQFVGPACFQRLQIGGAYVHRLGQVTQRPAHPFARSTEVGTRPGGDGGLFLVMHSGRHAALAID